MATCIVHTGNSAGVNVRASKNTSSAKLGEIDNDVTVDVVRCDSTWATLMYNRTPAFVQHRYLVNPPSTNGDGLSVNANATCNGNSVNVRNAANGNTVVMQINKGASYKVLDKSLTGGYYWYRIGTNQWVRGDYLTPNSSGSSGGGGDTGTGTGVATAGVINGTSVRVRKEPNTTSAILAYVNTGDKVTYYVGESYSGSGYHWYRCRSSKWSGDGYIATNYVLKEGTSGGDTGTGASDDFTDNVTTNPTVTTYYSFQPSRAVAYAKEHSSNTNTDSNGNKVADPKRNKSFGEGASNACANFVHQCLLAGGARMFDAWCYKLPGIPSAWDHASWTLTNKGRRRLLEKKWIERIPVTSVKAGDIIYTYYSDYKKRNMNTPFNHVTIAISDYNPSDQGCYVCGHTTNQNNKFKKLSATGIPCAYCYRVKSRLGGDGTEKAIDLTDGNSKAV